MARALLLYVCCLAASTVDAKGGSSGKGGGGDCGVACFVICLVMAISIVGCFWKFCNKAPGSEGSGYYAEQATGSIEHHVTGGAVLVAVPQAVPGAQITLVRRAVVTAQSRVGAVSRD